MRLIAVASHEHDLRLRVIVRGRWHSSRYSQRTHFRGPWVDSAPATKDLARAPDLQSGAYFAICLEVDWRAAASRRYLFDSVSFQTPCPPDRPDLLSGAFFGVPSVGSAALSRSTSSVGILVPIC